MHSHSVTLNLRLSRFYYYIYLTLICKLDKNQFFFFILILLLLHCSRLPHFGQFWDLFWTIIAKTIWFLIAQVLDFILLLGEHRKTEYGLCWGRTSTTVF